MCSLAKWPQQGFSPVRVNAPSDGKTLRGHPAPDVRKSLIDAAQDGFQVFPAQTHQTLAHQTALHGNFRKEFDKKQEEYKQKVLKEESPY